MRVKSCVGTDDSCRGHCVVGEHLDQQRIYIVDPSARLVPGAVEASVLEQFDHSGAHGKVRNELVVVVLPRMNATDGILPRLGVHCDLNLVVDRRPMGSLTLRTESAERSYVTSISRFSMAHLPL